MEGWKVGFTSECQYYPDRVMHAHTHIYRLPSRGTSVHTFPKLPGQVTQVHTHGTLLAVVVQLYTQTCAHLPGESHRLIQSPQTGNLKDKPKAAQTGSRAQAYRCTCTHAQMRTHTFFPSFPNPDSLKETLAREFRKFDHMTG